RVLGRGHDLEVLVLQLEVEFLPTWQIESAPSPGGPGHEQYLLAAETRQTDELAFPIRDRKIGSRSRLQEAASNGLNFAKAPDSFRGIGDHRLPNLPGETGQVEVIAVQRVSRQRNANVVAARALRLDLEFVDARQIALADPQ